MRRRNRKRLASALAGAAGGLAASFAMGRLHALMPSPEQAGSNGEDSTVKAANSISQTLLHRNLTTREKKWAGPAVHYAFGTLIGALYGAMRDVKPKKGLARGALYGSAVCLLAHEIAVPAMGLSPEPIRTPLKNHMQEWGAHVVYGLVTDLTRAAILKTV